MNNPQEKDSLEWEHEGFGLKLRYSFAIVLIYLLTKVIPARSEEARILGRSFLQFLELRDRKMKQEDENFREALDRKLTKIKEGK